MSTRVLLLAAEWFPRNGGVSSFNLELASALRVSGFDVLCVVRRASRDEILDAREQGVSLTSAIDAGVDDESPFDLGQTPDIIVGHDRWTGPWAERWRQRYPAARLALFLHVYPGHIDSLKTRESLEQRESRLVGGRAAIRSADSVFAVGPHLRALWAAEVVGVTIHEFLPGLPTRFPSAPRSPLDHGRVLLVGRAEDAELKGVLLAAAAMRSVTDKDAFRDVEVVIRGAIRGREARLEETLRPFYPKPKRLQCRAFDPDRQTIANEMAVASVMIQPSLEEGFGLSFLEAVAASTPALVADRSGVARLVEQACPALASQFVIRSSVISDWSAAIERVLADLELATANTIELRGAIDAFTTWASASSNMVEATLSQPPTRTTHRVAPTPVEQLRSATAPLRRFPRRTEGKWVKRAGEKEVQKWLQQPQSLDDGEPLLLLLGAPGAGKSALLAQVVEWAESENVPILGIKADLIPVEVDTADALRAHLGLQAPVLEVLQSAIDLHGTAYLVIDQLDALCELVDTRTARLRVLLQHVREAVHVPGLRILVSVRPFELDHEARLRALRQVAHVVDLPPFSVDELRSILDTSLIRDDIDASLRSPHAVDLLCELKRLECERFSVPPSAGLLRARYWQAACADKPDVEATALALAERLAEKGALWLPRRAIEDLPLISDILKTGVVRQMDPDLIGFRHQTLFDFARARTVIRSGTLRQFVETNTYELGARPLVRSALLHLRSTDRAAYNGVLDELWSAAATLHIRLLLVDTILEADVPTSAEARWFLRAVADTATRRRALSGIANRPRWIADLDDSVPSWMINHARDCHLLLVAMLESHPNRAADLLRKHWFASEARAVLGLEVLGSARRLRPELDNLVLDNMSRIVRTDDCAARIGSAIARDDSDRAALFYARCLVEIHARERGESSSIAYELLQTDIDPERLLAILEPSLSASERERRFSIRGDAESGSIETVVVSLLQTLAGSAPEKLLTRATSNAPGSNLDWQYAEAFLSLPDRPDLVVGWFSQDSSRLAMEPIAGQLISVITPKLSSDMVAQLDAAIDRVAVYAPVENDTVEGRRDTDRANRVYRLHLRSLLPQELLSATARARDEAEAHQLPHKHSPAFAIRGGFVQSPMSAEQIAKARNVHILNALSRERDVRYITDDLPIGGPRQLVSELARSAKSDPARIGILVQEMRDRGYRDYARGVLHSLSDAHEDLDFVEQLVLSLMEPGDARLSVDDECAWALEKVAERRPGLRDATVAIIHQRLALAGPEESERLEQDEFDASVEKSVIFRRWGGGGAIPNGACRWIEALATHYCAPGRVSPDEWASAIREALRVQPQPETFRTILNRALTSWWDLGGAHAEDLLNEIASACLAPSTAEPLGIIVAHARHKMTEPAVISWVERLDSARLYIPAAELATLLRAEPGKITAWAAEKLDAWRESTNARAYGAGVFSAAATLIEYADLRPQIAELVEHWLDVVSPASVALLLENDEAMLIWGVDAAFLRFFQRLLTRVPELEVRSLANVLGVMELTLQTHPRLVLEFVDRILERCVGERRGDALMAISDCLALTFSLRLELPSEISRIHALFERALAADAPAAQSVLVSVDGYNPHATQFVFRRSNGRRRKVKRRN